MPNDRPHISLTCRQTDKFDRPYRIQDLCRLVISYVVVVLSAVLTNLMFREIEKYEEPGLANRIVSIVGSPDISVETAESPDIRHISRDEELSFHNRMTPLVPEPGVHLGI